MTWPLGWVIQSGQKQNFHYNKTIRWKFLALVFVNSYWLAGKLSFMIDCYIIHTAVGERTIVKGEWQRGREKFMKFFRFLNELRTAC